MEVEEELLGKKKERMGAMKCKWWRIWSKIITSIYENGTVKSIILYN
jgi:hypothetical protein